MKASLVAAVLVVGCVAPAQQPGYYGPPPVAGGAGAAPAPGAPTGAPATGAPPPAAAASCQDTLTCYGQCNPMTDACVGACDQRTTPDGAQGARAVLTCMAQSGCRDQACVAQACGAPITACTGQTLSSGAVATATATAGPSGGGGSCEQVMQPEYYEGGDLKVPRLACALTQADLTGSWQGGMGTSQAYADSGGNYVGSSTVNTSSAWTIDASGGFTEHWVGVTTSVGAAMPRSATQDNHGTFELVGGNVVKISREATADVQASTQYYIVYGWFAGPSEITMTLQGPFSHMPTAQDFADSVSNTYKNESFHRAR